MGVLDPPGDLPHVAKWAQVLLACVCDELAAEGRPACRCSLVPGQTAAWDQCCECDCDGPEVTEGQAWVAAPRIFPTAGGGASFPAQQTGQFRCGPSLLAAEFQVGVLRCSQALTVDGKTPSSDRLNFEAIRALQDQQAVLRAVLCCFIGAQYPASQPWALGAWTQLGPQGGCAGGALTLTISTGAIPPTDSDGSPCSNC